MRFCLALAAARKFVLGATDIKTAFLNARLLPRSRQLAERVALEASGVPTYEELALNQHGMPKMLEGRPEVVVIRPPAFLVQRQYVSAAEAWAVLRAMYGIDQSPRDWSLVRDTQVQGMRVNVQGKVLRLWRSAFDSQLWLLSESKPCLGMASFPDAPDAGAGWGTIDGWVCIYVDDVLVGACLEVTKAVLAAFEELWQCDKPQLLTDATCKTLRLLGIDISLTVHGTFRLTQSAYIRDLAERHKQHLKRVDCPLPVGTAPPDPEEYTAEDLRKAQQAVGELLWVSQRTRVDAAFSVSRLASWTMSSPRAVLSLAYHVLSYLVTTSDVGLLYPTETTQETRLQVFTDASFAPQCEKSFEWALVRWCNCTVAWTVSSQAFMTHSSCEAELLSVTTGACFGEVFWYLVKELVQNELCLELFNDNQSAVSVFNDQGGSWRTRALKIRANYLKDRLSLRLYKLRHVARVANGADVGTKVLGGQRLKYSEGC